MTKPASIKSGRSGSGPGGATKCTPPNPNRSPFSKPRSGCCSAASRKRRSRKLFCCPVKTESPAPTSNGAYSKDSRNDAQYVLLKNTLVLPPLLHRVRNGSQVQKAAIAKHHRGSGQRSASAVRATDDPGSIGRETGGRRGPVGQGRTSKSRRRPPFRVRFRSQGLGQGSKGRCQLAIGNRREPAAECC